MVRVIGIALLVGLLAACHKSDDHTPTSASKTAASAASAKPAPPVVVTTQQLVLPATFRGTTPCHDCRGIDTYLELRYDHSDLLEERILGRPGNVDQRIYTLGHFNQVGDILRLEAKTQPPRLFHIRNPQQLQQLDPANLPIPKAILNASDQQLLPTGRIILHGHYVYSDNQGFFRDCDTNHSWPVATAGDNDNLEAQYQALAASPNAVVFARVEAHIAHQPTSDGEDSEEALVIDHVINLNISEDCTSPAH